jgi:two-component system, OmpR family, phosphate regulon sensor histidine kinase PhoR
MSIRISLRYKILGMLGILLLAAVAFYTLLASSIFRQEKIALIYDLNHSIAVNTAAQLRSTILQTGNQMKLHLFSELYSSVGGKISPKALKEAQILGIELVKKDTQNFLPVGGVSRYPIHGYQISQITRRLKEAQSAGYSLWTEVGDPSRFFLATQIDVRSAEKQISYFAIAELDPNALFSLFRATNLFRSYLTNRKGEVVLSYNKSTPTSAPPIPEHPLLVAALEKDTTTSGVLTFGQGNEEWYGAYSPVGIANLYFLSQASRDEVTSATQVLIERSLLFGLIVVTATFMVSILFSRRLTENLRVLTESARDIGEGKLDTQIEIQSGDEVEELALSFNTMTEALRASREAIERYNRELEEKVALRTQQLHDTNAAIKEVQEQLLKSTHLAAVGEVAGKTAHEVLNPLTAIASRIERTRTDVQKRHAVLPQQFREILSAWETEYRKGGLDQLLHSLKVPSSVTPSLMLFEEDLENLKSLCDLWVKEQQEVTTNLEFVQRESERIHRILDRMRQLVRASDFKEDVPCHEVLRNAIATMADFAEKQGVEIREDFHAELDQAHLNRDEFMQVITNLIRNAYQAIAAHKDEERRRDGLITLRTNTSEDHLRIEIEDNGIGIPESQQALIFEQGFTTKAPDEGTGLGLAICRRYARAFGGEVELISSAPGRGTVFLVSVPLLKSNVVKIAV